MKNPESKANTSHLNHQTLPASTVRMLNVPENSVGQRIDNFLIRTLKGVPKTRLYRALRKGEVRVNKKRVDATYRLEIDDVIRIPPIREGQATGNGIKSLHESMKEGLLKAILLNLPGLLVLNKPAGWAVHGGSGVSLGVIEALRLLYPDAPMLELVHRLDKETSGCLMIAKKNSFLRGLHAALREHRVEKTYCAWVVGHWPKTCRRVAQPLQRHETTGSRKVTVESSGQPAETLFRVIQYGECAAGPCTLIEAKPKTGRTHQIRVHTAFMGYPIIGDDKYGNWTFNETMRKKNKDKRMARLFLHALRLDVVLSTPALDLHIEAPLGPEWVFISP